MLRDSLKFVQLTLHFKLPQKDAAQCTTYGCLRRFDFPSVRWARRALIQINLRLLAGANDRVSMTRASLLLIALKTRAELLNTCNSKPDGHVDT